MFKLFCPTNTILLTFVEKKLNNWKLKMFVNSSNFKANQNILDIVSCIENANIHNQWKYYLSTVICFRITPKIKIDFVESDFA